MPRLLPLLPMLHCDISIRCWNSNSPTTKRRRRWCDACFGVCFVVYRSAPPTRWPSLTTASGNCPETALSTRQILSFRATCRTWTHGGATCRLKIFLAGESSPACCVAVHCVPACWCAWRWCARARHTLECEYRPSAKEDLDTCARCLIQSAASVVPQWVRRRRRFLCRGFELSTPAALAAPTY